MKEGSEDTNRKMGLSEQDAGMLHADLMNLISALERCNKYLDIFFTANGIYDKAADMVLLQMVEDNIALTDSFLENISI